MDRVTAARLYKATSNVDYVILPAPALTIPSGGDYEELRFRVAAVDESADPFNITAWIARTLVTTSGWKPMEFLLRAGTLVATWLIEQESFSDLTPLFHTGNTDKTGGLEAALGRWKTGLFEQETGRRPIGFAADFAGYHGAQASARLSAFPLVTVDYTVQLGDEHRYQLGVLIENSHGGSVRGAGVDIWLPSRLVADAEGFTSGLGAKRVDGIECSGFRWRSEAVLFAGEHVRVCSSKETKLGYRVDDELYHWIGEKAPLAEFEVFAGDFPRLGAFVPVRRLHQF